MSGIVLTAYDGAILGPIAKLLGTIMNWIYVGLCALFHVDSIPLSIVILIITIIIYMCLLPLTIKQQKFSKLSQKMQPEIQAIREKYKGKKDQESMQAMNMETQYVYQKYGVSPTGSCVQMLIQMPILFALYRVFYNIPAYMKAIRVNFTDLVADIQSTGSEHYLSAFADLMSKDKGFNYTTSSGLTSANVVDKLSGLVSATDAESVTDLQNYIVDIVYKLPSHGWESTDQVMNMYSQSVNTLVGHLGEFSDTIATTISNTFESMQNFNYLFGMNISDTPWYIIRTSFSAHNYGFIFLALLIPLLSYLSQLLSIKLMPQSGNNNDQMARQMKTMNMLMPLMSLFLCFTVPVGLGFYWICTAVVRCVQQFFINKHIENLDLEDIIRKNEEKAKKKREKMGVYENQIRQAAAIKTRTIESKANQNVNSKDIEEKLEKAAATKQNAKSGSMASKANLVKDFNERNSHK